MSVDISIVIVNYNVRHFLEQALSSIRRAQAHLSVETWVVDNNSVDDSLAMVRRDFPETHIIANKENVGFSTANNQAIAKANGKYILLLNPDTVLQEDTLIKCFDYMESHPNVGALGVKMIDGSGQFLPESKRGFPTPWVSFCKATGLSSIFKKSKLFNRYHLGYLDKNETHSIDVLCGAFMFMPKKTLDEIGYLDEAFFMYGEDIDLSYRVKKAGQEVHYFPETKIIHFKGESTKKGSLNYVRVFYQAMIIFSNKHFSGQGAGLLNLFLRIAIIGRALFSIVKRFWSKVGASFLDFIIGFASYFATMKLWATYYFKDNDYFNNSIYFNFLIYTSIVVTVFYFSGIYTKKIRVSKIIRNLGLGLIICLAVYGLLNNSLRNSRAVLVLGSLLFGGLAIFWRMIQAYRKSGKWLLDDNAKKRIIIVGEQSESDKITKMLMKTLVPHEIVGSIAPPNRFDENFHISKWDNLIKIIEIERIDEIIFSIKNLEWKKVMSCMSQMGPSVTYKMMGDDSISILGSQSKNTSGELYTVDFHFNIQENKNKYAKRISDIILAILLLLLSPILIVFQKNKANYFSHVISVLTGNKAMVGYDLKDNQLDKLPVIKQGIIPCSSLYRDLDDQNIIHRSNLLYAKDYNIWKDVDILFKGITKIG